MENTQMKGTGTSFLKMKIIGLVFLSVIATFCSGPSSSSEEETLFQKNNFAEEDLEQLISAEELELFHLVNEYRGSMGLGTLSFSMPAYSYAEEHTALMIAENALSHKNFTTRASGIASETDASHVEENVAKNKATVTDALNNWLASASHKTTIEGNFDHTAISIKESAMEETFYTQIFIKEK